MVHAWGRRCLTEARPLWLSCWAFRVCLRSSCIEQLEELQVSKGTTWLNREAQTAYARVRGLFVLPQSLEMRSYPVCLAHSVVADKASD